MSLATLTGARIPHPATKDPLFANVLLLLNGQTTLTTDAGPSNRTLITSPTAPTLDATVPLFGFPTYKTPVAANGYLGVANDAFVAAACTNQEWCEEVFVNIIGAGSDGRFSSIGKNDLRCTAAGVLTASCTDIGASSYSVTSATTLPFSSWHHMAFLRDKSGATVDFLKLYLDGILVGTSISISKSAAMGTGTVFGRVLGWNNLGAYGNFSNYRLTGGAPGCARYYGNFTPPTRPFPTS